MDNKQYKTVVGFVRYDFMDYAIETNEEEFTFLSFENEDKIKHLPINRKLGLVVRKELTEDGRYMVYGGDMFFTPIVDYVPPDKRLTDKHVGIFYRSDSDDNEVGLKDVEERKRNVYKALKQIGRHKWDIKVDGWVMDGNDCNYVPHSYCYQEMLARFDRLEDKPDWTPTYWHVIGGSHGYCGQASRGGTKGVTYNPTTCNWKTTVHELGHNFGLMHGNTKDPITGETKEYADKSTVMGGGYGRTAILNAPHMVDLELVDEDEILTVTRNQQVLVVPHELPVRARHRNEKAYVRFYDPVSTSYKKSLFYVSIRKAKGIQNPAVKDGDILYIHESTGGATYRLGTIRPGEKFTHINGATIEFVEYKNEAARVNILFDKDSTEINEMTINSEFPERLSLVELGEQHNGAWYEPDFENQGIDLQIRNGRFTVYWYTFNVNNTSRRYFFGTGTLGEGVEEFDLYTTANGYPDLSGHEVFKVGKAQLYFIDNNIGIFNYNTETHGRGSLTLEQLTLPDTSKPSGCFFNDANTGEGYTVQFVTNNRCVVYYYTYGPKNLQIFYASQSDSDTQRWYMGIGDLQDDGTYDLTVYDPTGPKFLEIKYPEDNRVKEIGKMKVTINNENSLTLDYSFDDGTISKSETVKTVRLF